MTRKFKLIAGALALASLTALGPAVPAFAQDAPDEARTTYMVILLKLAPGADERWTEMQSKYYEPAAKAAGLPATQVHWLMDGDWDLMLLRPLPRGMATLDTHNPPERKAFMTALAKIAGGEEAAKKLNEENRTLVSKSVRYFSHTHP